MNTNRTPRTSLLVASLSLSLGAVACGGGSMAVEDGVVTETRTLETVDAQPVRVRIQYPEARLLAGDVPELDIRLVPRVALPGHRSLPRLPGQDLRLPPRKAPRVSNVRATPRPSLTPVGRLADRARLSCADRPGIGCNVPCGVASCGRYEGEADEGLPRSAAPEWMKVSVEGDAADAYEAVLVQPGDGADDRVDPAILR